MHVDDLKIVVSCPIKNDNEYLIEFVEHYLNLGFNAIYLYDNNDDDSIIPSEILASYINKDKVKIINYRKQVFNDVWHRKDFFSSYDFDWVLFVDDDEFLELKHQENIKTFLARFDENATKIAFNNLHYGDNDNLYYEDGSVQDRFPRPLSLNSGTKNYKFNCAVKSLLKKVEIQTIQTINAHTLIDHLPYYNADNRIINMRSFWRMDEADVSYGTAYIKHYCTKSLEEFVKCKIKRAMSNNMAYNERFDINSYYYMYNERTRKKDELYKLFREQYLS